jgi:hypothetical protein
MTAPAAAFATDLAEIDEWLASKRHGAGGTR